MVVAGCGDDEGGEPVTTTTGAERPEGPSADLSEEVTGGGNAFIGELEPWTDRDGYVQEEVVAAGIATAYEPVAQPVDGRWVLEPASEADYRTRVLVRRPANPEDFSGVVLVEWHNVSGGVDANPGFANLQEEILRQGHAWVGVSTQSIGVQGGDVAVDVGEAGQGILGLGLRGVDPERYGSLEHPGDRYAFDIYAQVAAAVRGAAARSVTSSRPRWSPWASRRPRSR